MQREQRNGWILEPKWFILGWRFPTGLVGWKSESKGHYYQCYWVSIVYWFNRLRKVTTIAALKLIRATIFWVPKKYNTRHKLVKCLCGDRLPSPHHHIVGEVPGQLHHYLCHSNIIWQQRNAFLYSKVFISVWTLYNQYFPSHSSTVAIHYPWRSDGGACCRETVLVKRKKCEHTKETDNTKTQ